MPPQPMCCCSSHRSAGHTPAAGLPASPQAPSSMAAAARAAGCASFVLPCCFSSCLRVRSSQQWHSVLPLGCLGQLPLLLPSPDVPSVPSQNCLRGLLQDKAHRTLPAGWKPAKQAEGGKPTLHTTLLNSYRCHAGIVAVNSLLPRQMRSLCPGVGPSRLKCGLHSVSPEVHSCGLPCSVCFCHV